ncbi:MAG: nuclear transport factor 2 family protein [Verrucomicrobia bacterium]|nr:nuclear transport factor 2 family protein [Verrucomicrobiota bacterium]
MALRISLVLLAVILLVVGGCSTVPRNSNPAAAFLEATEQFKTEGNLTPGSPEEAQAIERVKVFLGRMTLDAVNTEVPRLYAANAYLNDTLKTLHGPQQIQEYFRQTLDAAESFTADFQDVTRSQDGYYYFRWIMKVRMKKVAKGETITTPGITLVRFDKTGRILIHQDYWDSTSGLFEHVPGLGYGIRAIKARL